MFSSCIEVMFASPVGYGGSLSVLGLSTTHTCNPILAQKSTVKERVQLQK
jgi:hypothetical protein